MLISLGCFKEINKSNSLGIADENVNKFLFVISVKAKILLT